jgi:hypothetical protein
MAPERPKPSLAELARKTVAAKEAEKRSLAASTLAALSARGAAESPLRPARRLPVRAPAPPPRPAAKSTSAEHPPSPEPQRLGQRWGVTIAALGVAAAVVLVLQGRGTEPSVPAEPKANFGLPPQTEATSDEASRQKVSSAERTVAEREEPAELVELVEIPSASTQPGLAKGAWTAPPTEGSKAKPSAVASKPAAQRPSSQGESEEPEPEESAEKRDGSRPSPGMSPASGVLGETIPMKPSAGAAQAALGSVMTAARACVTGQTESSRASVTFGSDGAVKEVEVSGAAAGTPAERCVRTALSRARVQPFSAPSFTVGATVRPL